jgi:hypothetical protein
LQHDGDGLRLDGRGLVIAALGNGTDDFFGQAERSKAHKYFLLIYIGLSPVGRQS